MGFANVIQETDSFNILTHEYIYNGGGVGIGDFNKDGLQDVFLCGNMVPNKLYLNLGSLKFKDITDKAAVNISGKWNLGVSIVDINNDGWQDIYVSATMNRDSVKRKNMLFINKGLDKEGIPVFEEQAAAYGIDFGGYSVTSAFLDYDRDGDLDLYLLVNVKTIKQPATFRTKIIDGTALNNDKLFRNNGNGTFTDVTLSAGIKEEGFGLGLAVADFNSDGWPDMYVSNDYLSNDVLYLNNQNGTFKNSIAEFTGHQSQFSMGNDAADFNNDAMPDIITLDMLPENNARIKTTIANKSYQTYINNERFGYQYQYVRNMLQLNNGLAAGIKFSEIGQLAGVFQTEWSWSPLFLDVDNDGWKDLLITNGFPKDITDKDFANYRADVGRIASIRSLVDSIPVVKIPNYAFKNNGDLTFANKSDEWGIDMPSFSSGAAFADLDNDGDLDYIVNNINDVALVYENTLYAKDKPASSNYLDISLAGSTANVQAIGAKLTAYYDHGKMQYNELNPYRGFLSSVQTTLHFGLGGNTFVDSIRIDWPDGKTSRLGKTNANQKLTVDYKTLPKTEQPIAAARESKLFSTAGQQMNLNFKHEENDQNDFNTQRTLPHKFFTVWSGDCRWGYQQRWARRSCGGRIAQKPTQIFIQGKNGKFNSGINLQQGEKLFEDEGLLLFDIDNDKDLDLYIVAGSLELNYSPAIYQDHLYINDGSGNFKEKDLPASIQADRACVLPIFDADGDLDLFVGGRVVPGAYPTPPESYLFQNNNGTLTDVTDSAAPGLKKLGMITDALWTDYNNDGKFDLMIVGEFLPISFFKNTGGKFVVEKNTTIENKIGWWNSISSGDFDQDGDTDYIVGNLGQNNNYHITAETPLELFAKDFDGNGSIDPIMACYLKESMTEQNKKLYPMHFWDELNSQSPLFRRKFSRYRNYGKADIDHLFTEAEKKDAHILEANEMASGFLENKGGGQFTLRRLDTRAQVAPVFGIVSGYFNDDSFLDFAMVGNDYGNEVFAGRYDAFTGLVMLGDGKSNFSLTPSIPKRFLCTRQRQSHLPR